MTTTRKPAKLVPGDVIRDGRDGNVRDYTVLEVHPYPHRVRVFVLDGAPDGNPFLDFRPDESVPVGPKGNPVRPPGGIT